MFESKNETKIVISLKSSAVEVLVVEFDKIPKILFAKKEKLLLKEAVGSEDFIKNSILALNKIFKDNSFDIKKAFKKGIGCELIFYPPWFLPEIILEKNKTEKISLKKFFFDKVKPPQQKDYKQIENKITNILLNGYHLTKLRDVESDDIEINMYRSFISKESANILEETIKKEFPQISVFNLHSSVMEFYESIKSLFVDEDNVIFLDIGGEITEIGIILNDVLTSIMSVPFGSYMFIRDLDTFVGDKKSLGAIKFLGDSTTDEKLDQIKNEKIEKLTSVWFTEIFDAITENSKEYPKKVLLFSDSDSIDFFKMILEKNQIKSKFNFVAISPTMFDNKVSLDKSVQKNIEYLLSAYYLSIKS